MLFCRGIGRKVSIPFLVLSILGWILLVIGFGLINNTDNYFNRYRTVGVNVTRNGATFLQRDPAIPPQRAALLWFPHWCVLIVGPFLYICTIIHLIIGRFFTGVFTKFLTALYLITGGAVVYDWAVKLFSDSNDRNGLMYIFGLSEDRVWLTQSFWGLWPLLEFVGTLSTIFFMTLFMMMWPFFSEQYYEEYEEVEEEEEVEDNQKEEPEEQTV